MTALGSVLHVSGTGCAFVADLYDCLSELALPDSALLVFALDAPGWSAVIDTLQIGAAANAIVVGCRPPAAFTVAHAQPARLPVRDCAVDAVLLGTATSLPERSRGVLDEVRRVLRPGGGVLIANPGHQTLAGSQTQRLGVAWCRLLEEHGFSVEKTLATRPASTRASGRQTQAQNASVYRSSRTRDATLAAHAWESLIVQARRS